MSEWGRDTATARHRAPHRSRTSWLRRFGQWLGLIV